MYLFRPMEMGDLAAVLDIITTHDEDDGEAADADFADHGLENQYVIEIDEQVCGVCGFRLVDATDNTAWLSWTYLAQSARGNGHGKNMLNDLVDKFREAGGRKLFVKVSDYKDPYDGNIYEAALHLYKSCGFEQELVSYDFYDEDENQLILGLTLIPTPDDEEPVVEDEKPVMRFTGVFELAETDGSYTFSWEVPERKGFFNKQRSFTTEDLLIGLRAVKNDDGRKVFLTFPSNLPLIHKPLQESGFKFVGQLEDYYEVGVHDMHFVHDLSNLD